MKKNNPHHPYKNGFEAAEAALHPHMEYEPKDIWLPYIPVEEVLND